MAHKDVPSFVMYGTMFKLETRPRASMLLLKRGRHLECVNCGTQLVWNTYTLDPSGFDKMCHECKMDARTFWKGKLYRELDDA